jgi:hypothetical protein
MQATIEYIPLLCNGAVNTPSQQWKGCFLRGLRKAVIRKISEAGSSSIEVSRVELRDAILQGYELESRGIELSWQL